MYAAGVLFDIICCWKCMSQTCQKAMWVKIMTADKDVDVIMDIFWVWGIP